MARAFDDLRSDRERARDSDEFLRNLQQMFRSEPLPPPTMRIRDINPQNPSVDTFEQRYRGETPEPREGVMPGYQERFQDPSKVISERLPPSLNAPNVKRQQAAPQMFELPEGFTLETPSGRRG